MPETATKRKRPKHKTGCDCLNKCQEEARKNGFNFVTRLSMNFETGTGSVCGPFLQVEKRDDFPKRKALPMVVCAYCPFCGKRKDG